MKQGLTMGTIRRRHARRLVRAVAVFFVLFTVCDIALPQYFCGGEEVGGLPLHLSATAEAGDRSDGLAPEAPSPGQDSDQALHDEDCFCCCAHVLAGPTFTAPASAELSTPRPILGPGSLPTPPLPLQYHPPRFA